MHVLCDASPGAMGANQLRHGLVLIRAPCTSPSLSRTVPAETLPCVLSPGARPQETGCHVIIHPVRRVCCALDCGCGNGISLPALWEPFLAAEVGRAHNYRSTPPTRLFRAPSLFVFQNKGVQPLQPISHFRALGAQQRHHPKEEEEEEFFNHCL